MIETFNGHMFAQMIVSAAAAIENERQPINELNVFPVPDGDTGTNMSLTMSAATAEVRKTPCEEAGKTAEIFAHGLLRGARGNSGVILSLLFRGFSKHVKDLKAIDGINLATALSDGVDAAYRAVMKPAEGTVLTVSRAAARRAAEVCSNNMAVEYVLAEVIDATETALEATVEQNPVLKKAGVVDAGAKGYLVILQGMMAALQGNPVQGSAGNEGQGREKADFSEYSSEDIRFGYCTECIIMRTPTKKDPIKLRAFLESIGDSLVFVDDDEVIKIHLHTNNPGKVLEASLDFGSLTSIKIENMREQHTQKLETEQPNQSRKIAAPTQKYGVVSVCAGDGIAAIFKDLGSTGIIKGGQTMNPSTDDILSQIDATPTETVFVLPNNKNIIMAAEQCVPLSDKKVIVLPTKSIPQGIAALLSFDPSLDEEENREAMLSSLSAVATGHITYAARESTFDGNAIREGDFLALLEGQLLATHTDMKQVTQRLISEMVKKSPSYITVFYGEGVDESDAKGIQAEFKIQNPGAEVSLIYGGQPVYYYLISAE